MNFTIRIKNIIILLITVFAGHGCLTDAFAQQSIANELNSPIHGKLMPVGTEEISGRVGATFAFLAGEQEGRLVILNKAGGPEIKIRSQWKQQIGDVKVITLAKSDNSMPKPDTEALRAATAVWHADDLSKEFTGWHLNDELKALLRRDGVIGGQGIAAEIIAILVKKGNSIRDGFNFLPNSCIWSSTDKKNTFTKTLNSFPGRVGWEIPPLTAVVIHKNRKISVIGNPDIKLRSAANGEWPERVATIGPPIDELPYTTDLISWNVQESCDTKGGLKI